MKELKDVLGFEPTREYLLQGLKDLLVAAKELEEKGVSKEDIAHSEIGIGIVFLKYQLMDMGVEI